MLRWENIIECLAHLMTLWMATMTIAFILVLVMINTRPLYICGLQGNCWISNNCDFAQGTESVIVHKSDIAEGTESCMINQYIPIRILESNFNPNSSK